MTAIADHPDTTLLGLPAPPCSSLLGWHLVDHDAGRGWVRIGFEGKRDFLNPAGFIQGGIQTAMLDDAMGPAVWIHSKGTLYTASIDITVSFLAPARPGPLFAEGQVVRMGKTIAFMEARLFDPDGELLARATASARVIPADRLPRPVSSAR